MHAQKGRERFLSYIENIITGLFEPFTKPEFYQKIIMNLIIVLIYVIVAFIVSKVLNRFVYHVFKVNNKSKPARIKRSRTMIVLIQNILTYLVWFIALTTILKHFGISVSAILASAGVVGVAIGFGAQTMVKDIISGFFIIFENQFGVGDYVRINTSGTTVAEGTVEAIGLRSTRVLSVVGERFIIPNGTMNEIINYSMDNGVAIVDVPIDPNEDADTVISKLEGFLKTIPPKYDIFTQDPEVLGVNSIDMKGMTIRLSAETLPVEQFAGARIIWKEVQHYLNQEGIRFASPVYTTMANENQ